MATYELKPNQGAMISRKRVGRGCGCGLGKTCGRGMKGQKSRSGGKLPFTGFEGGQTPLQRRLPKRGFVNIFKKEYEFVNLKQLNKFPENETVNLENLKKYNLIDDQATEVKVLATGELEKKLNFQVHRISKSAKEKIEKLGGSVEMLPIEQVWRRKREEKKKK